MFFRSIKLKKNILIYIISLVIIFQNSTLADIQQFRKDKKPPPTERRQIRPPKPNISNKNNNDRNKNANKDKLRTRKSKQFPLFPDEYTVLDDFSNSNTYNKEIILTTLEHARQKYIQAMILVDKGDTTNASLDRKFKWKFSFLYNKR